MHIAPSILTLAGALLAGLVPHLHAQSEPEHHFRLEVITHINGDTTRVIKEFDGTDENGFREALRDLGLHAPFSYFHGDGDLQIDIRDLMGLHELDWPEGFRPGQFNVPAEPRAWLGVSTSSTEPNGKRNGPKAGAVVQHVTPGSPAARLGLQQGDIITQLNDRAIAGPEELAAAVRAQRPGTEVKITWLRNDRSMTGITELGEQAGPRAPSHAFIRRSVPDHAFLGVSPMDAPEGPGVTVQVEAHSAATDMGMRTGDRIRTVNGQPVDDFAALAAAVKAMAPGDTVTIEVEREGRAITLSGPLGRRTARAFARSFQWDGSDGPDRPMYEELRREMDDLRREMDRLRQELQGDMPAPGVWRRETRIHIQSRPLEPADKDLLSKKGVTGLDRELDLGDLRCHPNPGDGHFRLRFDAPERGDLTVQVFDATGERVYDERITAFRGRYEHIIDLSDRAAGTYLLVIGQHGRTATRKLVKQ